MYKRSTATIIGRYKQVSDAIRINVDILARKSSVFSVCTHIENGGFTKPNTRLTKQDINVKIDVSEIRSLCSIVEFVMSNTG